jgi:hypothetical protein
LPFLLDLDNNFAKFSLLRLKPRAVSTSSISGLMQTNRKPPFFSSKDMRQEVGNGPIAELQKAWAIQQQPCQHPFRGANRLIFID